MELRDLVMMTADANDGGRIVNTGDLIDLQISEAAREGRLWIDPATGYGFAFLPWKLTTDEDRQREAEFFNAGEGTDEGNTEGDLFNSGRSDLDQLA